MSFKVKRFRIAAEEQVCLQPVLDMNTDSDKADVTSLGRLFHTFAPATGNARYAFLVRHACRIYVPSMTFFPPVSVTLIDCQVQ